MCHGTGCCKGHCIPALIGKILLIIGGINWGLVGAGILLGSTESWNVINTVLGSVPTLEGIVYLLVGVAAVMKILGCKCQKCIEVCASCTSCGNDSKTEGTV